MHPRRSGPVVGRHRLGIAVATAPGLHPPQGAGASRAPAGQEFEAEARRQSLPAAQSPEEADIQAFIDSVRLIPIPIVILM